MPQPKVDVCFLKEISGFVFFGVSMCLNISLMLIAHLLSELLYVFGRRFLVFCIVDVLEYRSDAYNTPVKRTVF